MSEQSEKSQMEKLASGELCKNGEPFCSCKEDKIPGIKLIQIPLNNLSKRKPEPRMDTASFVAGLGAGMSVTALIANQPDWWVWGLVGIIAMSFLIFHESYKEFRDRFKK